MKSASILSLVALLSLGVAVATVIVDNRPQTVRNSVIEPTRAPYSSYVAGEGIVEAGTGNIAVGTPVSGIVTDIYVKAGDHVNQGDPLFKIDDRELQAQILTASAKVNEAQAALLKPQHRLVYAENLVKHDPNAVGKQDLSDLRDDAALAQAALETARSQVAQLNREIELHTVKALLSGEVLQLQMRVGEFLEASSTAAPMMLFGDDKRLKLRVNVDEYDAWRIKSGADAMAFLRGNPNIKIPLHFEYIEPYVIPKISLTGRNTERTDTRVLQVIYSFERNSLPVYAGQLVDVYIQAPPVTSEMRQ